MIDNSTNPTQPKEEKPVGPIFDKLAVANNELKPLIMQVFEICKREGIPLICSVAPARDKDATSFITTAISGPDGFFPPSYKAALDIVKSTKEDDLLSAYHIAKRIMQIGAAVEAQQQEGGESK